MRDRSRATILARIGAFVGMATATFGGPMSAEIGRSLAAPQQNLTAPLAPRAVVAWSIEVAQGFHSAEIMHGEGFVGPDGTLELGPYGSVAVAGLTPDQARVALERHLARYLKNPRVRLTVPWNAPTAPRAIASAGGRVIASIPAASGPWQAVPRPGAEPSPVGLGSPSPLADAITTGGEWRPVPRPGQPPTATPPSVVQTTWNGSNRSSTEGAFAVAQVSPAGVSAPMPEGPIVQTQPNSGSKPPPPTKAENLQIRPHKVPGAPMEGLPPAVCDGGMGMAGPAPTECKKVALPTYVIEPPDILVVASTLELRDQPIQGPHLVRPDGTVSLGIYGSAYVAGMTMDQARDSIIAVLSQRIKNVDRRNVYVDVMAYNSKFYYVITDGAGYGETVIRFPVTGSETVLDAISQIFGIPPVGNKKKIWVARSFPCGGHPQTLPVDWCAIAKGGDVSTNYQIMPGDRIYVQSQGIIRADSVVAKIVSPFERLFGVTLLASSAINSIKFGATNGIGTVR